MRTILVAPANRNAGLTSICTGLVHALDRQGVRVGFCKPIAQPADGGADRSNSFITAVNDCKPPEPLPRAKAEELLKGDRDQDLMELVTATCLQAAKDLDVLVVEGMVPTTETIYATRVNALIAKALDADLVLVATPHGLDPARVVDGLAIAANAFRSDRPIACVINRVDLVKQGSAFGDHPHLADATVLSAAYRDLLVKAKLVPVGCIPFDPELAVPRTADVASALHARCLVPGDASRRVRHLALCGMTAANALPEMRPGTLILAPSDRNDLLMAASLAAANGMGIAGLLLVGEAEPDQRLLGMCRKIMGTLPVHHVRLKAMDCVTAIMAMNVEVPVDDRERVQQVANSVANRLDADWLKGLPKGSHQPRLSPPAFRHRLIEAARAANKRIVLPEGTEPRTLKAVAICHERRIARCVLLGNPDEIRQAARAADVRLPDDVEIVDHVKLMPRLTPMLVEWRKAKGMTPEQAEQELSDTIMPGTIMLKLGEVDGLVSGAVHTTAHTIRPALQLVKTAPGMSLVSSCFFMCMPDQVLVFGDCAVNPDPTAEQLADIAIQSADSALAFGLPARVAMLSYSTGASGQGADVDKVVKATELAKSRRPDLLIDGPLQYDAAIMPDVARQKAPKSKVAGQATVFIFPDLNTGNVTYKAVQRAAGAVAMGPMLQGMAKPVNDLSRGCLVDDIVFTIALTAIQATQAAGAKSAKA